MYRGAAIYAAVRGEIMDVHERPISLRGWLVGRYVHHKDAPRRTKKKIRTSSVTGSVSAR